MKMLLRSKSAPIINLTFLNGLIPPLLSFSRASAGYYINSSGLLAQAASNEARFDYDPLTLGLKGLLLEEQRTNLIKYSEDLGNNVGSAWTSYNVASFTGNGAAAPNGTTTACVITTNGAVGGRSNNTGASINAGTAYTASGYFQYASGEPTLQLTVAGENVFGGSGGDRYIQFNGSTGAFIAKSAEIAAYAIQALPNGWFRVSGTFTPTSSGTARPALCSAGGSGATYNAWGVQLEPGNFPTSYIPTTSAVATRAADMLSSNDIIWFNPSQGSILTEASLFGYPDYSAWTATFNRGNASNQIGIYFTNNGPGSFANAAAIAIDGTSYTTAISLGFSSLGSVIRQAVSYGAGNNVCYASGLQNNPGTFGGSSLPSGLTTLTLGNRGDNGRPLNGWIRSFKYWNRALLSSQLQQETK